MPIIDYNLNRAADVSYRYADYLTPHCSADLTAHGLPKIPIHGLPENSTHYAAKVATHCTYDRIA